MPHRKGINAAFVAEQPDLMRYAQAASGDQWSAADLVQEAWLRCDRTATAGEVLRPTHLIWRVLRNLCIDRRRQLSRDARHFVASIDDAQLLARPDECRSAEDLLIARDELARVRVALERLDPRTRAAFEMHRLQGAKLREIADTLGISVTLAHELVGRATAQVRDAVRSPDT